MLYANGYSYRRKITVDSSKVVGGTLTDFIMLIAGTYPSLKTYVNGGRITNASGYDIRFETLEGVKIPHELAKYDGTTGQVVIWLKVPFISNGADTSIYMYYGKSGTSVTEEQVTTTWSNYFLVYHGTDALKNVATGATLTKSGTPVETTGKIDKAQNFDNPTDYITGTTFSGLSVSTDYSMQAWAKHALPNGGTTTSGVQPIVAIGTGGSDRNGINFTSASVSMQTYNGTAYSGKVSTADYADNAYHHIVGTHTSANAVLLYIDGVAVGSAGNTFLQADNLFKISRTNSGGLNGTTSFVGDITEVRLAKSVLSANWIATEYNNHNSPSTFYSVGDETYLLDINVQDLGAVTQVYEKKYTVKVYDGSGNGTLKGTYGQLGGYSFGKAINGGLGELVVELPRLFDNYNSTNDVNIMDEVQIWVQDRESGATGIKIYSGYIREIETNIDGSKEGVIVRCIGYGSLLGDALDWDGTKIQVVRNSTEVTNIVKDVIDKFRTNNGSAFVRLNYATGSTTATGITASYTSDSKYCLESIERLRQMAGADWWWYVDASNVFYFKAKPTTPTHTFTFGKDISSLQVKKSTEGIVNTVLFWNGLQTTDDRLISRRYYSSSSKSLYGERVAKITDSRVTDTATASGLGYATINALKDINVSVIMKVKDSNLGLGYDIESVEAGHTCKVVNVADGVLYSANLLITRVDYTPEEITIYAEDMRAITGRELTNIRRSLDTQVYGDGVDTVTSYNLG